MEYMMFKHSHLLFVVLSIALFYVRGISRLASGKLAKNKAVFISSHSIDTLLLLSAVGMMVIGSLNPLTQPWLLEKVVLVLVYIGMGFVVAKSATKVMKASALGIATVSLMFIGKLAVTKAAYIL